MALLQTKRFRLRPLALSDAPSMTRLLSEDTEAVRMTERLPEPCTEPAARNWIKHRQGPGEHVFAIETLEDGVFIGCIGFKKVSDGAGLGYWVGRPFWNRGSATEAGQAILDHARSLGVRTIMAKTFPENRASARVLSKLGFTADGQIEKNLPQRGGKRQLLQFRRTF
jgi:RimJ/RimL family protein N-acetyltransferase